MGIGTGVGKTRAYDAAVAAISSPLLDFPIERAKGVVFTITGNSGMSLQEVNEVAAVISEIVADDANIIFGIHLAPGHTQRLLCVCIDPLQMRLTAVCVCARF